MNKLLVITALAAVLSGCKEPNSIGESYSGDIGFRRICVDNVEYLLRSAPNQGYMAPHFKPDGSLYTCN